MSQQPPPGEPPFVPTPPPTSNSPYPPDVLARQAAIVPSEAKTALILSIVDFFCAGFILGIIAFKGQWGARYYPHLCRGPGQGTHEFLP